jgi:hypothetical protein
LRQACAVDAVDDLLGATAICADTADDGERAEIARAVRRWHKPPAVSVQGVSIMREDGIGAWVDHKPKPTRESRKR